MIARYLAYLKNNPKGLWFKRKLYGWGWVPVTWQGWLVVILYVGAVLALTLTQKSDVSEKELMVKFLAPLVLLTFVLISICYKKGESPKWQWGQKKED